MNFGKKKSQAFKHISANMLDDGPMFCMNRKQAKHDDDWPLRMQRDRFFFWTFKMKPAISNTPFPNTG